MAKNRGEDYEGAFRKSDESRSAALTVTQGPLPILNQKEIAGLAIKYRLPAMMPRGDLVESGGLLPELAVREDLRFNHRQFFTSSGSAHKTGRFCGAF